MHHIKLGVAVHNRPEADHRPAAEPYNRLDSNIHHRHKSSPGLQRLPAVESTLEAKICAFHKKLHRTGIRPGLCAVSQRKTSDKVGSPSLLPAVDVARAVHCRTTPPSDDRDAGHPPILADELSDRVSLARTAVLSNTAMEECERTLSVAQMESN